ncbi:hypothetical protein D0Z07_3535 [Hyphodiscus hymeniophilus]|uniref:DUF7905 domain-containing protein n=1 Tax=Hyphodiscus hymeniophilus TaxID=353542 RepID=A0A9P7AYB9_9HELO|nr:hypothetical protein D0Z07_3535 [Hyphodiscus hymeniophilus]
MKLFDSALKVFDHLREEFEVHIDWNEQMRSLRINCVAQQAVAEENVAAVIEGIKVKYRDAQAQIVSATPTYIIVPPTSEAIRACIQPEKVVERDSRHIVTNIKIAGERLAPAALSEWEVSHRRMNEENSKNFRTQAFKRIFELQDLIKWMRMRIQFGHVNLRQFPQSFLQGKYSFEMFGEMMKKSRVVSDAVFDRKMEAEIAINLIQKIVRRRQDFAPKNSRTASLDDVINNPRNTEIIFISTAEDREQLRLEAEVESVEFGALGKYQIGHTRLFADDARNKLAEITTMDIEREFDWTLEIIQDSEIKEVPQALRNLIAVSLDNRSAELVDPVGLPYPAIALRVPIGFKIKNVVMRSVFQYQWTPTSNIVEIAIYREWAGVDTRSAPKMQASISMFGADWDMEMESVNDTISGRNWDKELSNFFGQEQAHERSGFKGLMAEIREIQRLLKTASTEEASKGKLAEEKHQQQEAENIERQMRELEVVEHEDLQHSSQEMHQVNDAEEESRRGDVTSRRTTDRETTDAPAMAYTPLLIHF